MSRFYEIDPTPQNYWRAIILFGRNTASYKFALAQALIDLHATGKSNFTLEELAHPYTAHLCQHLQHHPKQGTSESSTFLTVLTQYNNGQISQEQMIAQTIRHGFTYVLDAFHQVHNQEAPRFFIDQRKQGSGIQLTDSFFHLSETTPFTDLTQETESRWQLVETAWEQKISRNTLLIEYQSNQQRLIDSNPLRRTPITSARSALNGYQKGRCFYCYRDISILHGNDQMADVDHFFPHKLKQCDAGKPIDGVANLVLACQECNRGTSGKFDRIPSIHLLERLYIRNEYLISSHHPLRETLITQTGNNSTQRQNYLQQAYNCAILFAGSRQKWEPSVQGIATF